MKPEGQENQEAARVVALEAQVEQLEKALAAEKKRSAELWRRLCIHCRDYELPEEMASCWGCRDGDHFEPNAFL